MSAHPEAPLALLTSLVVSGQSGGAGSGYGACNLSCRPQTVAWGQLLAGLRNMFGHADVMSTEIILEKLHDLKCAVERPAGSSARRPRPWRQAQKVRSQVEAGAARR